MRFPLEAQPNLAARQCSVTTTGGSYLVGPPLERGASCSSMLATGRILNTDGLLLDLSSGDSGMCRAISFRSVSHTHVHMQQPQARPNSSKHAHSSLATRTVPVAAAAAAPAASVSGGPGTGLAVAPGPGPGGAAGIVGAADPRHNSCAPRSEDNAAAAVAAGISVRQQLHHHQQQQQQQQQRRQPRHSHLTVGSASGMLGQYGVSDPGEAVVQVHNHLPCHSGYADMRVAAAAAAAVAGTGLTAAGGGGGRTLLRLESCSSARHTSAGLGAVTGRPRRRRSCTMGLPPQLIAISDYINSTQNNAGRSASSSQVAIGRTTPNGGGGGGGGATGAVGSRSRRPSQQGMMVLRDYRDRNSAANVFIAATATIAGAVGAPAALASNGSGAGGRSAGRGRLGSVPALFDSGGSFLSARGSSPVMSPTGADAGAIVRRMPQSRGSAPALPGGHPRTGILLEVAEAAKCSGRCQSDRALFDGALPEGGVLGAPDEAAEGMGGTTGRRQTAVSEAATTLQRHRGNRSSRVRAILTRWFRPSTAAAGDTHCRRPGALGGCDGRGWLGQETAQGGVLDDTTCCTPALDPGVCNMDAGGADGAAVVGIGSGPWRPREECLGVGGRPAPGTQLDGCRGRVGGHGALTGESAGDRTGSGWGSTQWAKAGPGPAGRAGARRPGSTWAAALRRSLREALEPLVACSRGADPAVDSS